MASKPRPERFLYLQRTSSGDLSAARSIEEVDWADDQKRTFIGTCGALMHTFGLIGTKASSANGDVVLSPPYGQRNVATMSGEKGGVWPEVYKGNLWVFLHPSLSGETTRIEYSDVRMDRVVRLVSRIAAINPASPRIEFTVEVAK